MQYYMYICQQGLISTGMHVQFHSEDPDLLLVGERSGVVRLYSLSRNCATLCLRGAPLLSLSWPITMPSLILTAGPQGLRLWNLEDEQYVHYNTPEYELKMILIVPFDRGTTI